MRKVFGIFLLFLFLIPFTRINADTPEGITVTKNAGGYLVNFSLPQYQFTPVKAEGADYLKLDIVDYGITNIIGQPQLPQVSFFLAIAQNEIAPSVQIQDRTQTELKLDKKIYPYQMPWEKNKPLGDRPFTIDRAYYQTNGSINAPFVTISEPFILGGVTGVRVTVYPFAYNPAENKMLIAKSGSFQILLQQTAKYDQTHSKVFNDFLRSVFVNYEGYSSKTLMNYLIITAPDYQAGLANFVTFKGTQGYNVTLVTTTVTGTTTTAIKNYIQQRYNDPQLRPEFVLLVGDVDKIPNWTGSGSNSPPTDLNYGLLAGTDLFADVFTGRFPITSPTELSNMINKTMYMESNIAALAKKNVFMASSDNYSISEGTHNYVIDTYFQPNGYTNIKLYCHTYSATTQQVRDAFNANQVFGIYSGHGSTTSWADGPVFSQTDVRNLTNTIYPYVYSFACITGSYHMSGECFAETWVRIPKGGASFYGSSVNSFWDEDDILEKRLIKALFDDNLAKVTPMMDKAKYYFVQHYGTITSDVTRYMEMYNLMGDPSLPTRKVVPPDLTPPQPITDLTAPTATSNSITLNWTAPLDTTMGGVVAYDIRYSTSPIDTNNFNSAPYRYLTNQSDPVGTPKTFTVDSLLSGTTYYFAVKSKDMWNNTSAISNVVSKATLGAPLAVAMPDTLKRTLLPMTVVIDSVMIKNNSINPSTLNYSVSLANNTFPPGMLDVALVPVRNEGIENLSLKTDLEELHFGQAIEGQGGPDSAGYKWIDSDEPNGPQYVWNDISTTGTLASSWTATGTFDPKDEGYAGPFPLGFTFKFYKQPKTQIYVSSNGVLLFAAPTANIFTNAQIPTTSDPNNYIAPFWDDLDGRTQGTVHYKQDGDKFIIQFTNWQKYSATGSLTFQIVLYAGGKIMFYYNNMNATLNSATVGIENATGTNGLQMAYNAAYVKNNLAVKISAEPDWLGTQNLSGLLYNGNSAAIRLTFRSEDFPAGQYGMDLKIATNDPQHQTLTVPIRMLINNPLQPITVTAPNGGENWQVGQVKNITWLQNGITNVALKYSTNNGGTWLNIGTSPASTGSFAWTVPNTPSTQCKVRISNTAADTVFDVSDGSFTISAGLITWQSVINVKENGPTNQDLTFGMAPTATNGIDVALGEIALPPPPPVGILDARFELPVTPADYTWKDYRRDTLQSVTWLIKFQAGTAGYPMTFTWNPSALPAGSFMLKDNITGTIVSVDMKAQNSYSLTNTGITQLKIEFTKQLVLPMAMNAGWNMFSVPVTAANMAAAAICPGANSAIFGYSNGYVSQTTLTNGKGYWVRYPSVYNYEITGSPLTVNSLSLDAGWNMIGPYNWNVPVASITTTPTGIINSLFYGFNNGYSQATTLEKGKGYWVRTTQAGTMNLPASSAKNTAENFITYEKDWSKIIVSDAAGNSSTLYAGVNVQNINNFELPPVPPQSSSIGGFDVRYASNRNVEMLGDAKEINISGAVYPVTIQTNGIELRVRDRATNGKLVNEVIPANGKLRITNPAVSVIEVQTAETPLSYELMQNYPNPFNPTTSIKFGLPEKANVSLAIYNQLGEKIATLVNGELSAGYHKVAWNASNMTSGIYFYEIKTDKFSAVKKLILMK